MDEISKFLEILKKNEAIYLKKIIFPKIRNLDLKGLNVKKLQGHPLWRIRWKNIRIIFGKSGGHGFLVTLGFRKDAYKKLH